MTSALCAAELKKALDARYPKTDRLINIKQILLQNSRFKIEDSPCFAAISEFMNYYEKKLKICNFCIDLNCLEKVRFKRKIDFV